MLPSSPISEGCVYHLLEACVATTVFSQCPLFVAGVDPVLSGIHGILFMWYVYIAVDLVSAMGLFSGLCAHHPCPNVAGRCGFCFWIAFLSTLPAELPCGLTCPTDEQKQGNEGDTCGKFEFWPRTLCQHRRVMGLLVHVLRVVSVKYCK